MISFTMIAKAAAWPTLRAWFNSIASFEIGDGVQVSPTSDPPLTHLAMHAWITSELFDELPLQTEIPWISVTHSDDGTAAIDRFLAALSYNGLQRVVTPILAKPILWDSGNNMAWDGAAPARLAFTDTP